MAQEKFWDGKEPLEAEMICIIKGSDSGTPSKAKILFIDEFRCVWTWLNGRPEKSIHNNVEQMEFYPVDQKEPKMREELRAIINGYKFSDIDVCVDAILESGYTKNF